MHSRAVFPGLRDPPAPVVVCEPDAVGAERKCVENAQSKSSGTAEVVLRTDVTGRQWGGVVDELFHIGFVGIVDDNKMVERPRLGAENLQGFGQQFTPLVRDDDTDDFLGCAHGGVLSRSVSLMTWRTCSAASSPS